MKVGSTARCLFYALLVMLVVAVPSADASRALVNKEVAGPPSESPPFPFPPDGQIEGACGVGISSAGIIYVSDYYHFAVDVFGSSIKRVLVQPPPHPDRGGPCGLVFDAGDNLYVNYWHQSVAKSVPPSYSYGALQVFDSHESTGVAVDQASGNVYVNDRTYVAVYEPSGAPVLDGEGDPLRIGLGNLEDAFGVAVSAGKVYVPDAADNTVKVFEPAVSLSAPTAVIDTPNGFNSLVDASVAVDPTNGHLVVVDNRQSGFEHPEAWIEEFDSSGAYLDRACAAVVDGEPSGLAFSGGDLYVTSGNDEKANVFEFGPYSASPCPPPALSLGQPESSLQQPPAIAGAAAAIAPAVVAERPSLRRHRHHKRSHKKAKRHRPAAAKGRGAG